MNRFIFLLLFTLSVLTCSAQKKKSKASDYWNKPPDLTNIVYEGGNGTSMDSCVVIKNATNERDGIASEYAFIEKRHGKRFENWKPLGQATKSIEGRKFDIINIKTTEKEEPVTYYFDITSFYGKF